MSRISSRLGVLLPSALVLASSALSPLITQAQTPDKKTAVGVYISTLQYRGNLGSDFFKLHGPQHVGVGAHITRYLSPTFDLSLQGNYVVFESTARPAPISPSAALRRDQAQQSATNISTCHQHNAWQALDLTNSTASRPSLRESR